MNSTVRNKTSFNTEADKGLPELNTNTLRQLDAMTKSSKSNNRSTSFGAYHVGKGSPTRALFMKNRESLEDMLVRKFKTKYLSKE